MDRRYRRPSSHRPLPGRRFGGRRGVLATGRLPRQAAAAIGALSFGLIVVTVYHSTEWIGATFPGFLVMRNRVVPSVALPEWQLHSAEVFQQEVQAIDGVRVHSAAAVYEIVGGARPGTTFTYQFRGPDGRATVQTIASRRFSERDYLELLVAFLATGAAFVATGVLVFHLRPHRAASLGLLSAGTIGGIFAITAADLYGPHWFFRLHVLAEALVPASLLHLALVFPTNRLRRQWRARLRGAYLVCIGLAAVYEAVLNVPVAYSAVHLLASTAQGLGGLVLISLIAYDLITTTSAVVRSRIVIAALGTVVAFVVPTIVMAASGMALGQVPVNAAAFTGFLFPLSLGYAIARRDLLKLDIFAREAVLACVLLSTSTYFALASRLIAIKARLQ